MKQKLIKYADFKRLQRCSLNDFNRWVEILYKNAYNDGVSDARKGMGVVAEVSDQDLLGILRSVKGIGEKRADQALDAILSNGRLLDEGKA